MTGGAGFIGSHVVDELVEGGHDVAAIDVLHPWAHRIAPDYLNERAEHLRIDVRDRDTLLKVVTNADAVSHQASLVGLGRDFSEVVDYVSHNDVGTATLLQVLNDSSFSGRLVLASSMVVYGEGAYTCSKHDVVRPEPRCAARMQEGAFEPECPRCGRELKPEAVVEEMALEPRSVYGATKLHQEQLCAVFARETGVPFTALRYHNVYGPRMPRDTLYSGVAAVWRSALEKSEAARVFEDGGQIRDFVHVRDVARANVLSLVNGSPAGGAFNICSGEPRPVYDMARILTEAFGRNALEPVITGEFRLGDVRHVFASPRKACDELGWRAEIPFEMGIKEFATAPLR